MARVQGLYLKILCPFLLFLLPSLIWGQTGTQPRQVEAVDTITTGDTLATYEDYIMVSELDTIGIDDYRYHHRRLAHELFIKDDSVCYQLLESGDTVCVKIDTIQVIYGDPTDTSYYFQVQVNGGTIDSITHMELIQINNGTGINVTYNGTAITIASTVTDTDTYIDSVRQIQANNLDSIWLYRNDLSDSLLIVLDDSVGAGSDTYIDSIRHVNDGVLDSIWFYRSDMSDSLLLVLNDSVGAGGGGSDTYIDSVRQVVVGSLDSIWLYRNDLSDSLLIVLNDSVTVLPKSRFVFTDPITGELTTNGTWSDSILLYNGGTRYGQIDDKGNVSWGWLAAGSGNNNTRIGGRAGYRNQGDHNTYLGFQSGYLSLSDTHLRNTAIGYETAYEASGDDNLYMGQHSGWYNISDYSVYLGAESGYMTVSPSGSSDNNLAMGYQAARDAEGDNNVYLGNQSGYGTLGSNNIFIGSISTLVGSYSDRFALGGPSDFFMDGDMSTDSLTVNSTLTVRDVPASSAPDSVYVLGPGHELNSYPISSISGIDTYIDSAAIVENGLTDTLWHFRDSSGVHIDSFFVVLNDSVIPDTYIDSARQITVGLQDSVWLYRNDLSDSLLVVFQDSIFQDHDWYEIPTTTQPDDIDDNIWTNSRVRIGQDSLENAFTLMVNGGVAPFEMVSSAPTNIMRQRHRTEGTAWDHSYQAGVYSIISQNLNTAESGYYISMPEGYVGDATRPLVKIDSSDIGFWKYPSSRNDVTSVDSISAIYYPAYDGEIRMAPIDSLLKRLNQDSTTHRDFDFILLPLNDTLGTNIDSLNPDDSTDLYALIWHGGQVRIGETPYQIRYDTTQGGVDATAALQIMGQNDAIDIYHDSLPTIWIRNNKGDAQIRYSDNEMEHDTTPSFLEFGFINWQDTATMGTMGDTTLRHPFRVSSHANTGALEVYQDSILLGDYVEADTTITSTDLLGSGIFVSSPNGKIRLVTADTLNALQNVIASAPQEIDTFALNNDSLVLDLTNTTGGLKYVDFSNYNNSNITISNDSLFVGDSVLILPQGADSAGVVIPDREIAFGDGTRGLQSNSNLFLNANNVVVETPRAIQTGNGATGGQASFITIGGRRAGDGSAYLDWHSTTGTYGTRAIRNSGTNGSFSFTHSGTGGIVFRNVDAADIEFETNSTDRLNILSTGEVGINKSVPTAQLHVDGDVRLENLSGDTPTQMVWADDDGKLRFVAPSTFDDYNGWNLSTGVSPTLIGSGETVEFLAGSGLSVGRVGNTITYTRTGSDEYVDGISFNTGSGVLTLTRAVGADLTYDLDGRYLVGNQTITLSGDVTGSGSTSITTSIASNSIIESDLNVTNGPINDYVLTYNSGGGNFTWVDPSTLGGGGSDGDGIYDGSGTIGSNAVATTSGSGFTINVATSDVFDIDYNGGGTPIFRVDGTDVTVNDGMVVGGITSDQLRIGSVSGYSILGHESRIGGSYMQFQSDGDILIQADDGTGDDIYLTANDDLIVTSGDDITIDAGGFIEENPVDHYQVRIGSNVEFIVDTDQAIVNGGTTGTYNLEVNGSASRVGGTTWANESDRRLKRDVKPISDAYSKILELNPVTFHYKESHLKSVNMEDKLMRGYVAQEYMQVFPEDVKMGDEGYYSLAPDAVGPYTVAAVQQLIKEVQQLKSEIETLKKKK